MAVIKTILSCARATLIYNSQTTKRAFNSVRAGAEHVILNGVSTAKLTYERPPFSDVDGRIRLLMIGRINGWKGQDLLVKALQMLKPDLAKTIDVRFAGSAFGNALDDEELKKLVSDSNLACKIYFDGFISDPSPLYEWSDIVLVPSKRPEPFGLVAVEAMAHGRAVIAANHGGLTEIVLPDVTGKMFEPNNEEMLAEAITYFCSNPKIAIAMGKAGQKRYREAFTEERYSAELASIVGGQLN